MDGRKQRDVTPEFGEKAPGRQYINRPGAYGVAIDDQGQVALVEEEGKLSLPGGGQDGRESLEECLLREIREECGVGARIVTFLASAVEYVDAGEEGCFAKICSFYSVILDENAQVAWMFPEEAAQRLRHGSQKWALNFVRK